MTTAAVSFRGVSRHFGEVRAVDGIDLEVADGELFTLLGPSGSGKTTCLRMVAGFELPSAGTIELFGRDVTRLPPYERDVNTVFQDYALFPHMNVAENVGYGPMIRGVPKAERARRVEEALALVRLPGLGGRRPAALSGGQRQRVALARALVNRPRVLLLDEPLGALDLRLRQEMQVELATIQREVGITFLLVTHDQEEALTLSNRVAVFNQGRIEQVGTPEEIYERPATRFVAGFVGVSNVLDGELARRLTGRDGAWALRPERIDLAADDGSPEAADASGDSGSGDGGSGGAPRDAGGRMVARGAVRETTYLGMSTRYRVELDGGGSLNVVEQNRGPRDQGGATVVGSHRGTGRADDAATGRADDAATARPTRLTRPGRGSRVRVSWRAADLHPLATDR